jgi:FMN phosphatase YigB (HAD superfamily)
MMKSLYPAIQWVDVNLIGLDLDGTLYNEIDFISQVYQPIAIEISRAKSVDSAKVYKELMEKWIEKGSSYNRIFEEALSDSGISDIERKQIIETCLNIFHSFVPKIVLGEYVQDFLSDAKKDFGLFIVTDGNAKLQEAKFFSLGLDRWIRYENFGACGRFGAGYSKPSTQILKTLEVFESEFDPSTVVYFGDRDVDAKFARNSGFMFCRVHCMEPKLV